MFSSGCFIGKGEDVIGMLKQIGKVKDSDDDQLIYTKYLLANRDAMCLDTECILFQCLSGATEDVEVDFGRGNLRNLLTNSSPAIVHANGPTKDWFDSTGASIAGRWRTYYDSIGLDI